MPRLKMWLARFAILLFAAAAAFYALYVCSMGRVLLDLDRPESLIQALSDLAASAGMQGMADLISRLKVSDLMLAALLAMAICFGGEICFRGRRRSLLRRRAVKMITPALAVIAVLWVVFRLNNTSLYAWSRYIGGNNGYPLFGAARTIRRDEFVLWTPMALSQEGLGWPASNTLIGNGTDVTWVSMGGLPAWNAALIFKPLYWGFLLLGSERGLSFLCISRIVLLFLVSRKTAMLYTKGNQGLSIAAAVILTLSPMVQWFISQSIAEILIFGQGMVLAMHALIRSDSTRKWILYALLNSWLLGCMVLIGYPAWIIPALYLVLAAGIYLFTRPAVPARKRKLGCMLAALLPSLVLLGVVVYESWDTLQAVRSSVYPGQRLITGGLTDSIAITGEVWNPSLKIGLASIFYPLETIGFNLSNSVDSSPFLSFAPAGVVLGIAHQWRKRKPDPVFLTVGSVLAFFWLFSFIQLPEWFCKLTLLSQCSRPVFPITLCETILLIRARSQGGIRDPRAALGAAAASTAFWVGLICYYGIVRLTVPQMMILVFLYLLVFSFLYLDFRGSGNRLAVCFVSCVLLLAGGFVNPIQQGLDMLNDYELVNTLKSIDDKPGSLYAVEGGGYPLSEVPLLASKHSINTDQPYADLERWSVLDPDGEYQDVYNRLCHVVMDLAEPGETTSMEEGGNYIMLRLTREDLAALGVDYLITYRASMENATLVAHDESDCLFVWKIDNTPYLLPQHTLSDQGEETKPAT